VIVGALTLWILRLRRMLMVPLKASATCLLVLGVLSVGATVQARQGAADGPGVPPDRGTPGRRQPSGDRHGSDLASGVEGKAGGDRDAGAATEFFGARERAGSFAYVIDSSGSMATRNSLDVAKSELLASLEKLTPDARFGVLFYSTKIIDPVVLDGKPSLVVATAANKELARTGIGTIVPDGGSDHMLALRAALALHSEVIYFLTDADQMTNDEVTDILAKAGTTRIHCVEFGRGIDIGGSGPLRRLARATSGSYRYIDVTRFPR
jgi:hypothetical protein